jgi:outer membrane protein assembly factor BamE
MTKRKWIAFLTLTISLAISSGCVYRASMSQGNLIKEEDLAQVEVGMTKNQVRFLLGTPMIDDPFRKQRWDYVYYLRLGREDASFKRWVSVIFENDIVSEIRKDQELNPGL